jgi:hypothetical protein
MPVIETEPCELISMNCSNALLMKALNQGLQTQDSLDYFMMAAWSLMAAADVDLFTDYFDEDHVKYSVQQRELLRQAFYEKYFAPDVPFVKDEDDREIEQILGKYSINRYNHLDYMEAGVKACWFGCCTCFLVSSSSQAAGLI